MRISFHLLTKHTLFSWFSFIKYWSNNRYDLLCLKKLNCRLWFQCIKRFSRHTNQQKVYICVIFASIDIVLCFHSIPFFQIKLLEQEKYIEVEFEGIPAETDLDDPMIEATDIFSGKQRRKRSISVNDPEWPNMWYMVM